MVSGTFGLCLVRSSLNTCRGSLTWMCSDMGIMHPRASMYNQGTQTPTNLYILHVHDWGWHFTSPSLVNPLFSCLLFVVEFQTLSVPAVVCCAFLSFLHHHCIFARIARFLTMWLDVTALTEVPRHWAALRNEYFVFLLCICSESVAVSPCLTEYGGWPWLAIRHQPSCSLTCILPRTGENKVEKLMSKDKGEIMCQSSSQA